jgi:hypothetical protein
MAQEHDALHLGGPKMHAIKLLILTDYQLTR